MRRSGLSGALASRKLGARSGRRAGVRALAFAALAVLTLFAGSAAPALAAKGVPPPAPAPPPAAGLRITSLTLSASSVVGLIPVQGTVTLDQPAPIATTLAVGDFTFGFDPFFGFRPIPPIPVTVPAGSSTATFTVTPPSFGSFTIEARLADSGASAPLLVFPPGLLPPALTAITLSSPVVTGGGSLDGTLVLTELPAPAVVTLSSSSPVATLPASVTLPAGGAGRVFTVTTGRVTATTPVTISATMNGVTQSTTLTVKPLPATPPTITLVLNPTSVPFGQPLRNPIFPGGFGPFPHVGVIINPDPCSSIQPCPQPADVLTVSTSHPGLLHLESFGASVPIGPATPVGCCAAQGSLAYDLAFVTTCLVPGCVGTPPPVPVTVTVAMAGASQSMVILIGPNPLVPPPARMGGLALLTPAMTTLPSFPGLLPGQVIGGTDIGWAFGTITLTSNNYFPTQWATVTSDHPELVSITDVGANGSGALCLLSCVPDTVIFTLPVGCLCGPPPTSSTFRITTKAVTVPATVHIMAAWDGVISTVPLTILPPDPRAPSLASVTVQDFVSPTVLPPSLVSGSCCLRLNVRLGLPPQTGGTFTVTLTSSNQAALPLPSIVTQFLGAGGAFGLPSFDIGCCSVATAIRPGVVTAPTPVTITVSLNGSTVSTTVTVLPPSPPRTLTVTQASLNAGQVQVGGQGATPNAALTVNGLGLGGADAAGVFSIRFSPFFSASCKVTVSDGVSSAQATLTGCTPFPLGKPSFFQLAHSGVAGTALPYQAGGVGSEFVAFRYDWGDGTTLRDPATGFHPVDAATAAVAGDPVTHTFGTSGTFTVTVTALDPAGGSVQSDPAPVTIAPAPGTIAPPPPPPPPPPTAPASIVQLTLTATGRSGESISSTPAGLAVNVGTTASASFATGTSVTLTVSNGRTAIWSGGCSSGGAKTKSCSFTINAATSVTANVQ